MSEFFRKFKWLFERRRKEDELREELQFHLDQEADERRAEGLAEQDARMAARRELGNISLVREDARTAWGWITIVVGAIQLGAGFSLLGGNTFGRVIGIVAASLGALESLLSVGGTHPWWSLGIFALCLWILSGLFSYGEEEVSRT